MEGLSPPVRSLRSRHLSLPAFSATAVIRGAAHEMATDPTEQGLGAGGICVSLYNIYTHTYIFFHLG